METFAIIGFIFGLNGMVFAIISWGKIAELKKEVNALKAQIENL